MPTATMPTAAMPTPATRTTTLDASTAPAPRRATVRTATILLALAVVVAGCASAEEPTTDGASPTDDASTAPVEPVDEPDGEPAPEEDDGEPDPPDHDPDEAGDAPAQVARVTDHLADLEVRDGPGSGDVSHVLGGTTGFGSPRVLLVVDGDGDWLEVLLPVRPNGSTGWIRVDDVEVSEVELHVNVDLDARELTVLEAGEEVLTTTVAIGDADHPTPTGTFSITDKLETGDPSGPYGPFALGLSARSDVLTEFAGGDGQVGIHGTNVPSSIGEAASHGCIRVHNDVIEQLAQLLPLGTPVTVS